MTAVHITWEEPKDKNGVIQGEYCHKLFWYIYIFCKIYCQQYCIMVLQILSQVPNCRGRVLEI